MKSRTRAWHGSTDSILGTGPSNSTSKARMFLNKALSAWPFTELNAALLTSFILKGQDPARRAHGVPYVSEPDYPWQKLRAQHPGVYEKAVTPPPDPDGWFHARIVVASPKISVFVNESKEPSLVVEKLNERRRGSVGLWVGYGSGGGFPNLQIIPKH